MMKISRSSFCHCHGDIDNPKQTKSPHYFQHSWFPAQLSLLCQPEEMHHFSPSTLTIHQCALSTLALFACPLAGTPCTSAFYLLKEALKSLYWATGTMAGGQVKPPHTGMSWEVRAAQHLHTHPRHRGSDLPGENHFIYCVHSLGEGAWPAILILDKSRDRIEYFPSVFKSDIPGKETLPICWSF